MTVWQHICSNISSAIGKGFSAERRTSVAGGDINAAYRIEGSGERFFVKLQRTEMLPLFAAEAAGLAEIAASATVRVPRVIAFGAAAGQAYLVLEYIALQGLSAQASHQLGQVLAHMHRHVGTGFGWTRDNSIGTTPQINTPSDNWLDFWKDRRLGYQLALAQRNGYGRTLSKPGDQLLADCGALFSAYRPVASLLHGDLWSGNAAADEAGAPVIFDPAVYYGDREADLAMTELFGGFSPHFYAAYREAWPLDPGYAVRKDFYNLYHVLNHLNLFGAGYLGQAERMIARLLGELR